MSINYWAIKAQMVIILSKSLNTSRSQLRSVSILQFPNTFNWYLTTRMSITSNKKWCVSFNWIYLFIYNLQNYKIFLSYPFKAAPPWSNWTDQTAISMIVLVKLYSDVQETILTLTGWAVFEEYQNSFDLYYLGPNQRIRKRLLYYTKCE